MKLCKDVNLDAFFQDVSRCKGKINLISDDGDYLNLKSGLSQIFVRTVFVQQVPSSSYDIMLSDIEDMQILEKYMEKP